MVFTPQKQPTSWSLLRKERLNRVLQTEMLTKHSGSKFGLSMSQVRFYTSFGVLALIPFQQNKIYLRDYPFQMHSVSIVVVRWKTQRMHYGGVNY